MKPQDCVILLKLLASKNNLKYAQSKLADLLCMSSAEVNAGIKRLIQAGLLMRGSESRPPSYLIHYPIRAAAQEFFVHGIRYVYPAQLGEYTRGVPTSYAALALKKIVVLGNDPIFVWPYAEGDAKGVALKPLYSSVPRSVVIHPDEAFYELLALVDAIRCGRARERNLAIEMLVKKFEDKNERC